MKLIADSGSTKTDWITLYNGKRVHRVQTKGINPFYQSTSEIANILYTELLPKIDFFSPETIHFYGSGCSFPEKHFLIKNAFYSVFGSISQIHLETDLIAAARALCKNKEGIICILGTGSNSCHWDGKQVLKNVPPLGYILGDEGSGAVLGKLLIADLLKNQLPPHLSKRFYQKYKTNYKNLMNQVYQSSFPNRNLAHYTYFLHENIEEPTIYHLVKKAFLDFIDRNIAQYPQNLSVNFVGSIAIAFKKILEEALSERKYVLGIILKSPIKALESFHA